jgi:anti-anti-sigma regulatory factor
VNITDETSNGATVVHLQGNLDTGTAPELQSHLDALIDAGASTVIEEASAQRHAQTVRPQRLRP